MVKKKKGSQNGQCTVYIYKDLKMYAVFINNCVKKIETEFNLHFAVLYICFRQKKNLWYRPTCYGTCRPTYVVTVIERLSHIFVAKCN